ncbi:hypothetical protein BASA81_014152 [Batrachochytrium salamandrivorans]|nr:hypothetical protein BASA81_014152 [Batrachochytrium salamandrivorans]
MSVPDPSGSMSMLDMDMNMAMQHSDHPLAALVSAAAAAAAAAAVSTAEDSGDMDAMDTGGIDCHGHSTHAIHCLHKCRPLVTILRAISFKQKAYCTIAAEGMRLTAEDSRTVQAKAYLPKSLFREFKLSDNTTLDPDEELSFMVDIRMLTDCLSIFGAQQQPVFAGFLQLSYPRNGGELTLMLKDGNVVTACSLATYDNEPITDLHMSFGDRRTVGKIIMKSDWLKTAFAELDSTSSDLTLAISPQHPFFRISASGLAGESQLDYPRDTEVLESFNCTMATVNNTSLPCFIHV